MHYKIAKDALDLVAAVEIECGLPTPADANQTEVFGDYHLTRTGGFLKFDAAANAWDQVEEHGPQLPDDPCWTPSEKAEVWERIIALSYFGPKQAPADTNRLIQEQPFLYHGWMFAWTFVPELKRWELAPLGRWTDTTTNNKLAA